MIEVELKNYLSEFKNKFKEALLKHELCGIQDFDNLLDSINVIVSSAEENEDLFIPIEEHKIDKFGMAECAVRLANSGMSMKQMAETISTISGAGLTEKELAAWFSNYSNLGYTRKTKAFGNIFNVNERMQQAYESLVILIEQIENTPKEEFFKGKTTQAQVLLAAMAEMRQLTKEAKDIIKSINHQQKLEEFKMLVLDTIRKIDPATGRLIIEKLEQDKALFNALLPPK
jgi:hypothetical protein